MLISVTRLRVRSFRFMPAFLWHTFRSQRQAERAPGFIGGRLLVDRHRVYWTLTAWESEQAMKKFRGTAAHAQVMPRLASWCDEATYVHWTPEAGSIPEWLEAHRRLAADGHVSRVTFPSESHASRRFPPLRLKPLIGQTLTPRKQNG